MSNLRSTAVMKTDIRGFTTKVGMLSELDLIHWKLSFLVLSIISIDLPIMPVQLASR